MGTRVYLDLNEDEIIHFRKLSLDFKQMIRDKSSLMEDRNDGFICEVKLVRDSLNDMLSKNYDELDKNDLKNFLDRIKLFNDNDLIPIYIL